MRFSQRKRITPVRVEIQRESMDVALRNKLWSALQLTVFQHSEHALGVDRIDTGLLINRIWIYFFQKPVDTVPGHGWAGFGHAVRHWFFQSEWYEVFDFIEALTAELQGTVRDEAVMLLNAFLEDELSAYRLVDGYIAEITSSEEIQAIEDAITDTGPLVPVRTHLRAALDKLTDRKSPDYRNSIKEAISAVEAMCQLITGDPHATLSTAIKRLKDSGIRLHPSLEHAWNKLYGYTNDEGGIRHALSDEPTLQFSDAKYMLVSCSAFTSHLIELARSAGIRLH